MLRVGTDCSGIEAPIEALRQLNIPYEHVFSSEIDKYCIKSIKANYSPKIIFGDPDGPFKNGDIRERNIKDVPDIDLYVCGFPCQPFSIAGERKGLDDKRGNVFFSCLEVIKNKQPKYFILENVKGLKTHDKGKTWSIIWNELLKLKEYGYNIDWRILNTRDYGIPQNRERIFIIGNKEKEIIWPKKKEMDKLENYIDWDDIKVYKKPNSLLNLMKIVPINSIFLNLCYPKHKHKNAHLYSPSLVCSNRLWNVPLQRYSNINERLSLQGFNNMKICVSNTQFHKQIGNSISVNVLKEIFKKIF